MLRNEKTITIAGEPVTVYEVSVDQLADALAVLALLPSGKTTPGTETADLLAMGRAVFSRDNDPAVRLLDGATSLADGIGGVGGVAMMDLAEAWMEVNQPFFDRINRLGQAAPAENPTLAETPDPEIKAQAA